MAVFLVVPTEENPTDLAEKIQNFGNAAYKLPRGEWLIRYDGIAMQLSEELGITFGNGMGNSEPALVISIANYWGVADATVWEWLSLNTQGR